MNNVSFWRLATEAPTYFANDLSGKGAELSGGRWNAKGTLMVYTSQSIALACLETTIHLGGNAPLPMNRYLVRIDVPEDVWSAAIHFDPSSNVGWDAVPQGKTSIDWGAEWVGLGLSCLARVPSVVVPEEFNVIINPLHKDRQKIKAVKLRKWLYDARTWSTPNRPSIPRRRKIEGQV